MPAHVAGRIEISLAKGRTTAAFAPVRQRDVEAERFEHFDRCNPDVRLVIADERVVPQNDVAALPVAAVYDRRLAVSAVIDRRYMFLKPTVETLFRVMRQWSLV